MKKYSIEDLLTDPYSKEVEDIEIPQWPVKSFKSYGEFGAGDERHGGKHDGIDLGAPKGTPSYPMLSGIVKKVYKESRPWKQGDPKQGNAILIEHPDVGSETFYAHMDTVSVSEGTKVKQDTVIGTVGNSGNARGTSPHIHFEVRAGGTPINPRNIIGKSILPSKLTSNVPKKLKPISQQTRMAILRNIKKV